MPWRYFIFSTFILASACAVSGRLASSFVKVTEPEIKAAAETSQLVVGEEKMVPNISGSSIAPGGAGGRQSQFSAVLVNPRS
jgi:hypothetical protein